MGIEPAVRVFTTRFARRARNRRSSRYDRRVGHDVASVERMANRSTLRDRFGAHPHAARTILPAKRKDRALALAGRFRRRKGVQCSLDEDVWGRRVGARPLAAHQPHFSAKRALLSGRYRGTALDTHDSGSPPRRDPRSPERAKGLLMLPVLSREQMPLRRDAITRCAVPAWCSWKTRARRGGSLAEIAARPAHPG